MSAKMNAPRQQAVRPPIAVDQIEAARLLGISPKSLSRLAESGEPVGRVKLNRLVRYRVADLEAWLAKRDEPLTPVPGTSSA